MNWEIVFGLLVGSFIGSFIFCIKLIYHGSIMLGNIKSDNASFLGPFVLFFPKLFNETGQKHWRKIPPAFFILFACLVVMFFCNEYLEANKP